MKKVKSLIALLLVIVLICMLFASCNNEATTPAPGSDTSPGKTDTQPTTDTTPAKTEEPAKSEESPAKEDEQETTQPEEVKSSVFSPGEIIPLKMYFMDNGDSGAQFGDRTLEALNPYLEETYGLSLDIEFFSMGDWRTKVQLSLSGGEVCDLLPYLFDQRMTTMYNVHLASPMSKLLEEYAPDALAKMAPYLDACRIDGELYSMPTLKNWVSNAYVVMRKDILDELGLTEKAEKMSSWSEYTEILEAVGEKYTSDGIYPIAFSKIVGNFGSYNWMVNGDKFDDFWIWDDLGDKTNVTIAEGNKVSFKMVDPRYQEHIGLIKSWNDKGLIWPDSSIAEGVMTDDLMKQGVIFSMTAMSELGIEKTKSTKTGRELICTKVCPGLIRTSSVQSWTLGIPITAEEPEAAAYFINLLFTDATLMNYLIRGVEGIDYEIVDGQAKYGEDPCYMQDDFVIGDNTLLLPVFGNGADFYDMVLADINSATVSPFMGFSLDTSVLTDQISQLNSVIDQFNPAVSTGAYTQEILDEYIAKLEVAGVHEYIDGIQKQLDAWLAAK